MEYKVRFVDVPKHYGSMKQEVLETLDRVLSNGDLILRQDVRDFEYSIAAMVGTRYAVSLNSGFDALHHSVRALGLGPGDEVITVAHTFVATVAAIVHCGATPVLVDIDEDFNMNMDQFEAAITDRTKAVIPVHLNGRLCDMGRLMDIANRHNLIVIEDAAQALLGTVDGQMAGSFGNTGCFSLYPFKLLGAFGDGGIVTTNDENVANTIRQLRDHGQDRSTGEVMRYGFNTRLDNIQAAILNLKLKKLPEWIDRRRAIADRYRRGLEEIPFVTLPHYGDARYFDVYQNYVIQAERRDQLAKHMEHSGVECLISWTSAMHHHEALKLSHFSLPRTEGMCDVVLSLPMNTELTDDDVDYVINTIEAFY